MSPIRSVGMDGTCTTSAHIVNGRQSTDPATVSGRSVRYRVNAGFTLVELLLVLFVVALLASLVAPVVTGTIQRARESSLKEDLHQMRKALHDFYSDHSRDPQQPPP